MAQKSSWVESDFETNAVVTLTKPAEFGRSHRVERLQASFSNGSSGTEEVVVTINAIEVFRASIDSQATGVVWPVSLLGGPNETVVVTLDSGGPFNTGRLSVGGRTL